MDLKNLKILIAQLAQEKGISEAKVLETIEYAFASAYKKDYGKKAQKVEASFDLKTGKLQFWQIKQVINEDMILSEEELEARREGKEEEESEASEKVRFNPERHILLEEAKKIDSKAELGQELRIPLESKENYGRIAAQTAKQVILQRIREAERETVFDDFKSKEDEVISGVVQRVEKNSVFFDIGKVLGILPREEQIPGEFYKLGQRFKLYVLRVEKSARGPLIFLSRAFPKFISKLFELEVPEVAADQVVIKSIAREAGSRTKIAVSSEEEGIDPIGSVVGQRGTRVLAVIAELGGEKIDIIEYSDEPEKFIANALSPAKVLEVKIRPKNKAVCLVPEDQLSLAIGRNGQNVRLAAKLTGWKIDVKGTGDGKSVESPADKQAGEEKKEKPAKKKVKKTAKKPKKPKKAKKTKKDENGG